MSVWLVRAGRFGANELLALEKGLVTIGWNLLPDLSQISDRNQLMDVYQQTHPNSTGARLVNHISQVWAFLNRIQIDDLVALPLKSRAAIAIGKVVGKYEFSSDYGDEVRHIRRVEWIRTDIPRTSFDQDILYSLGAFMTVCRISRNGAENRIREILNGKVPSLSQLQLNDDSEESPEIQDIQQAASDQILEHIQQKFTGHKLAVLVDEILRAEGYQTRVSPPGRDGGVDILAGTGPMGFGSPRLCVQVKSSQSPADVEVLRGLQGILTNYHAEQGLLVSWGGFKNSVLQEARQSFFKIRLWDSGELLEMLLKNYDRLTDDMKAELPLKRVWALVVEDES